MKESIKTMLADQFTLEMQSAYLYLELSSRMSILSLDGIARWYYIQFREEIAHATHILNYLHDVGEDISFADVKRVDVASKINPTKAFEMTLAHEKKISESIRKIYFAAQKENDIDTQSLLLWYVAEQQEEEATASNILDKCKMAGDGSGALLLDTELGARVFSHPFATEIYSA